MIREAILEALKKKGVNQAELARHLEINRSSLNQFLRGKGKISMENIEKSFSYLGLQIVLKDK